MSLSSGWKQCVEACLYVLPLVLPAEIFHPKFICMCQLDCHSSLRQQSSLASSLTVAAWPGTAKQSILRQSGCQDAGVSCLDPSLAWPNLSAVRAENMRREGYELSVSPPVVVYRCAGLLYTLGLALHTLRSLQHIACRTHLTLPLTSAVALYGCHQFSLHTLCSL